MGKTDHQSISSNNHLEFGILSYLPDIGLLRFSHKIKQLLFFYTNEIRAN